MFTRQTRGLLDFTVAVLCLWAAVWHTPVGALGRLAVARMRHQADASVRPVLAYYSAGLFDAVREVEPPVVPQVTQPVRLWPQLPASPPMQGLARGVWEVAQQSGAPGVTSLTTLAHRVGAPQPVDAASLELVLSAARSQVRSDDALALAAFCGAEVARWAEGRAVAEGRPVTFEVLVAQLPPSMEGGAARASRALTLATAYGLAWPLAAPSVVTSGFGHRESPTGPGRQFHPGLDLRAAEGTEVLATADGVVTRAGFDALNGNMVVIDHGHGVKTAYCHNSLLLVHAGDRVRQGEVISQSGNTGRSTAPHLHYQVELSQRPVDPLGLRPAGPAS